MAKQITAKGFSVIAMIAIFAAAGQLALYLYLPSLPKISEALNISPGASQLTITFFLIPFGIAQLFYGPISDSIGRRPILFFGLIVLIIGIFLMLISSNIYFLCFARSIQGIGGASASVLGRAIISDYFDKKDLPVAMGYSTMAVAITPVLAPFFGGYIQAWFNWRTVFVFLLVYAIVILILTFIFLPETNTHKNNKIKPLKIILDYLKLLHNKVYICYVLCVLLSYLCQVFYLTISPFIFQSQFGLSPSDYGTLIVIPAFVYFIGNLISNYMNLKMELKSIITVGAVIIIFSGLLLYFVFLMQKISVITVIIPISVTTFGIGFTLANATTGFIRQHPDISGTAAAFSGFVQMTTCGILSSLITVFNLTNVRDLSLSLAFCGIAMVIVLSMIFYLSFKIKKK